MVSQKDWIQISGRVEGLRERQRHLAVGSIMDQVSSIGASGRVMVQVEDGSPDATEAMAGVGAEKKD